MNKLITKFILNITTKLKPILIKLLPIELLRIIKRKYVNSCIAKVSELNREPFIRSKNPDGINLIGFIRGEIGLGQSCRLIADAINFSNIDYTIFNYQQISSMRFEDKTWDSKISNITPYNINLIHLNPPDLALSHATLDNNIWDYKYNIAFWLWELEEFPEDWVKCFSFVDEIWAPSEFVCNSISKKTSLPVHNIVYPISAKANESFDRPYFKLPIEKFLFLCMYDSNSTIDRKNPIGTIEAFKSAFAYDDDAVGLVIKVNNPQQKELNNINKILKNYKNIYIISEILTKIEVNSLIKNCDVFVSLHRAEGFGLPLAEAMLLGKPAIATNWSANTEFMNSDNACMVDYDMIILEEDCAMYKKGNIWANPNINQAANYMKKLFKDTDFYNLISMNAQKYIEENLNLQKASKSIKDRINNIYNDEVTK